VGHSLADRVAGSVCLSLRRSRYLDASGNLSHIGIVASDRYSCAVTGGVKPNITFDWTAGSHSLAAASQRKR
jgi:hypothetical protein